MSDKAKRLQPLIAAARQPARAARYLAYIYGQDGAGLGWWLRTQLNREARVALAMQLLSREELTLEFDNGGYHWTAPSGDDITTCLIAAGEYGASEARQTGAWLREHRPRSGAWVVEVGANIGTTTLPLATDGWSVLAIEPVPHTFELLERNVQRNGLEGQVRARRAAVAAEPGDVQMVVSHSLGRSHIAGHGHTPPEGTYREVTVPALPLVDMLDDLGPGDVAWVWCDTNGAEALVVEGGAALWEDGVPLSVELGEEYGATELVERYFSSFVAGGAFDMGPRPISDLREHLASMKVLDDYLLLP